MRACYTAAASKKIVGSPLARLQQAKKQVGDHVAQLQQAKKCCGKPVARLQEAKKYCSSCITRLRQARNFSGGKKDPIRFRINHTDRIPDRNEKAGL